MSNLKDFVFASEDYLLHLNRIRLKSSKEFQEIAATMETFYDQMDAIQKKVEQERAEFRLKNAMLTLERDALGKEIGHLLNEAYKRDKELFKDLMEKFTILPKMKDGTKG